MRISRPRCEPALFIMQPPEVRAKAATRSRHCKSCEAAKVINPATRIVRGVPMCTAHAASAYTPAPGWAGISVPSVRSRDEA